MGYRKVTGLSEGIVGLLKSYRDVSRYHGVLEGLQDCLEVPWGY